MERIIRYAKVIELELAVHEVKCDRCPKLTPGPDQAVIDRAFEKNKDYVVPFVDWAPGGWSKTVTYTGFGGVFHYRHLTLCDTCTTAVLGEAK